MQMRRVATIWVSLILLILAGCTSSLFHSPKAARTSIPKSPVPSASSEVSALPTVGPVPPTCPVSTPTRQVISSGLAPVIGHPPVWATWLPGKSVYREGPIPRSHPPTNYDPTHGWQITKIVWEVGPDDTQPITIQGQDLFDHTPALIQLEEDVPTAHAVLDPSHPGHPGSAIGEGWAEWGSYLVVPKAGCYALKVSWATGQWTVTFAFGA
jgi:hypothetical protein